MVAVVVAAMVAAAAMEARVGQVVVAGRNVIWVCYVQLSNETKRGCLV